MYKWSLWALLDHESGDPTNGTHFRNITVAFNEKAQSVTVTSANDMFSHEKISAEYSFDEVKRQVASGALKGARYYGDFAIAAKDVLPGMTVEGIDTRGFFGRVGKVSFKP